MLDERERERIRKAAEEIADRTAAEQGLPPKITDPELLKDLAVLIRDRREAASGAKPA